MAARSKLAGKGSPNIAGANNSDFHFNLLTYNQYLSDRLVGYANELSMSRSHFALGRACRLAQVNTTLQE
ncbi:hypothetical protein D3C72_2136250 [compost metagenome]